MPNRTKERTIGKELKIQEVKRKAIINMSCLEDSKKPGRHLYDTRAQKKVNNADKRNIKRGGLALPPSIADG